MNSLAPIVLFVYNRPTHTRRTLEALAANVLADASTLYVYADGPKLEASNIDQENIEKTRRVLQERRWCKQVCIIESDHNQGLAYSIVKGVTQVVNKNGRVIVLEDDVITSSGFLTYMNEALNLYEDQKEVMHISGFFPPVKRSHDLPETFFYNQASCWGWATWARAWKFFDANASWLLQEIIKIDGVHTFNIDDSYPFVDQLRANADGTLETWAVKWQASIFLQNGLCLHPHRSMIKNIGFDGTGVHSNVSSVYDSPYIDTIQVDRQPLAESSMARRLAKQFYTSKKNNDRKNIIWKVKSLLRKLTT